MDARSGSAPGRLDLLGGVADYSGALVLEIPTRLETTVVAQPFDAFTVGPVTVSVTELAELARLPYAQIRDTLQTTPKWTHYVVGVALVLVRHGVIDAPGVQLAVASEVPQSVGVSSSAALEVATRRVRLVRTSSIRCSSPRSARRRRTTWSARRAGSWTRSRWPSGSLG